MIQIPRGKGDEMGLRRERHEKILTVEENTIIV